MTLQVPVSLLVASQTAKAAWGHVLANESCVRIRLSEALLVVGTASRVPFTACDAEELPVAHGLPSATDGRRFTAQQGETRRAVSYLGEGAYEVASRAERNGTEFLQIDLDGAVAAQPLLLLARCPSMGRTAVLATGGVCCRSCMHSCTMPSEHHGAASAEQDANPSYTCKRQDPVWLTKSV